MDSRQGTSNRRCFVPRPSFHAEGPTRLRNRYCYLLPFFTSHLSLEDYRLLLSDVPNDTRHSAYSRALKADFNSFSTSDGLIQLDSRRIVLPLPAVKPVLRHLHASHSGVNKTLTLARGLY